jgi:hypothetical protein
MRAELKRAIELRPDFLESYSLLAFVNLVTDTELEETLQMLKRALATAPARKDLVFMLAQLYMRKEDFTNARQLIETLSGEGNDAEMRQRAKGLMTQLISFEDHLARIRKAKEESAADSRGRSSAPDDAVTQQDAVLSYDPTAALREALRRPASGETQTQGTLVRIDCEVRGITFTVRVDNRLLKLKTDSFSHVDITSFSENSGREISCGLRRPEDTVVVCYLPTTDVRAKTDGLIKSIEFVPADFKLKSQD